MQLPLHAQSSPAVTSSQADDSASVSFVPSVSFAPPEQAEISSRVDARARVRDMEPPR
jgi:hypothetical protein